ncbi:hypothetical protein AURDEDRAFT_184694 [Auricularia subglabra TFB-10046 SS5]|nr:hypothetical protein AURDEDRAFT_184694 [Auricularia subglabra TFB-10046 SS5]
MSLEVPAVSEALRSQASLADPAKYDSYLAEEVLFHDADEDAYSARPRRPRDLIHPLVVRQWLVNGKLYREKFERAQSRFELFFDLVFVAFGHLLSDAASEAANGASFLQFVLTFYPAWALWSEFRTFMNQSGTDDITVRINVLLLMAILVGYSANASAIHFGAPVEGEAVSEPHVVATTLARRAGHASGGRDHALVAAVAFFIVGRGVRLPLQLIYAFKLPQFAATFISQSILHFVIIALCFPLLWVTNVRTIIILAAFSMAMDLVGRFIPTLLVFAQRDLIVAKLRRRPDLLEKFKEKSKDEFDIARPYFSSRYIPAINIEHHIERTVSFVIIVFGELVISVVYHATTASVGLSEVYGRAVLGLIIAFNFAWIYFDVEATGTFTHALRRHWFSSIAWNQLHWPLSGSLILASAALSRLVLLEHEVGKGHRWYFGGGLGCAMITLAFIGALHRNLEPDGLTRLRRRTMFAIRIIVGIVLCLMPVVPSANLSATAFLGVATGLTTFCVVAEVYGKLYVSEANELSASTTVVEEEQGQEQDVEVAVDVVEMPAQAEEGEKEGKDVKDAGDCPVRTWQEWVQMQRAQRAQREQAARGVGGWATVRDRRLRQWRQLQHERQAVNPLAGACGGA